MVGGHPPNNDGMGPPHPSRFANSRIAQDAIKTLKPKFSGQATEWMDFVAKWQVYWDLLMTQEPIPPNIEAILFVDNLTRQYA